MSTRLDPQGVGGLQVAGWLADWLAAGWLTGWVLSYCVAAATINVAITVVGFAFSCLVSPWWLNLLSLVVGGLGSVSTNFMRERILLAKIGNIELVGPLHGTGQRRYGFTWPTRHFWHLLYINIVMFVCASVVASVVATRGASDYYQIRGVRFLIGAGGV